MRDKVQGMFGRGRTIGDETVGVSGRWIPPRLRVPASRWDPTRLKLPPRLKVVMSGLWIIVAWAVSYLASARFEYKSLTLVAASVAALFMLAIGDPVKPDLGADPITVAVAIAPTESSVPRPAIAVAPQPVIVVEPQPEVIVEPQPEVIVEPQPEVIVEPQPEIVVEPQPVIVVEPQPEIVVVTKQEMLAELQQERPVQERPVQERPVQERPVQERPVQERPVFAALESFLTLDSFMAPESLTALIIEKSARLNETQPQSVASLVDLYQEIEYRLDDIRLGEIAVPRLMVEKMPDDIVQVESPAERKRLFIKLALPLILYANERIAADRGRLIALREKIERTTSAPSEQAWLTGLAGRYGLETLDLDALLQRVDVIPPSLALAQGAEESGWGTSRFVREGNAMFGQRTYDKGAGLVPINRDSDKNHEVKSFNGLMESVASYMTNLNTHYAYNEFRRIRAGQRALGDVDSYRLVGALHRYSERGEAYIATIRSIIDKNDLRSYDGASFGKLAANDSKI